jgi:hypothetical protein
MHLEKTIKGEAICNSPLNLSKSKFMYSFGRANRFAKMDLSCGCGKFYKLPSVQMTRSASIGKGTKFDFTAGSKSKSPVFYDFQSDFDQKHPHGPKYTFGVSREKMLKNYDINVPGPGKYFYLKPFGYGAYKYTLRKKCDVASSNANYPGPGQYQVRISPLGITYNSRKESTHGCKFGKETRFNYNFNSNPSPLDYPQAKLMGRIFESRFQSHNGITMSAKTKLIDSRENYPGPGAYRQFSEFGIYGRVNNNLHLTRQPTKKVSKSQSMNNLGITPKMKTDINNETSKNN